jgi:ferric-dicitrate binding protein FerR (iron transport regulator)
VLDPAAALGRLTQLAQDRLPRPALSPAEADRDQARARQSFGLVQARLARPQRRRRLPAFALGGVLAASVATLVLWPRDTALTVAIVGSGAASAGSTPIAIDDVLVAPPEADREIRFSDGTDVIFERTARGRVSRVTSRGARVRLEQGRARVKVVPRRDGEWLFDAGPCQVRVTGTQFDINWSQARRHLEVTLWKGSVIVKSPLEPEGRGVQAGERLTVDLEAGVSRVTRVAIAERGANGEPEVVRPAPTVVSAPVAAPSEVGEVAPAEAPASTEAAARAERGERTDRTHRAPATREARRGALLAAPPPKGWEALVAAGEFGGVLGDARRVGIDQVLGKNPAADVMALADAARFTGEVSLARRAFLAARARFTDTAHAHRAAFLLGRMAEDADGDLAKALEWYDLYLAAAPRGAHREEALGRKMTATLSLFGRASARPVAELYLARYGQGGYASAARRIVAGQ